jgi:hypothetical protein
MKIKFVTTWAHPAGTYTAGAIGDIDHDLAVELCKAGAAVPVPGETVETTVASPAVETRVEQLSEQMIRRPRKRVVEQ